MCDFCFDPEENEFSRSSPSSSSSSSSSFSSSSSSSSSSYLATSGGNRRVAREASLESQEFNNGNGGGGGVFYVHDEVKAKNYSLADVWNAIRTEKNFKYSFWLEVTLSIMFNALVDYLGNILILFALMIILFISYGGFFYILPVVEPIPWSLTFCLTLVFGMFKMFAILFHYIAAVKTNPGYVTPSDNRDPYALYPTTTTSSSSSSRWDKSITIGSTFDPTNCYPILENRCKKCDCMKPVRAHHCSTCKKCVLKMDHHCPWLGNCVGMRNYRYFLCFLFWVTFTTLYLAARSYSMAMPTLMPIFTSVIPFTTRSYAEPFKAKRVNSQDNRTYVHMDSHIRKITQQIDQIYGLPSFFSIPVKSPSSSNIAAEENNKNDNLKRWDDNSRINAPFDFKAKKIPSNNKEDPERVLIKSGGNNLAGASEADNKNSYEEGGVKNEEIDPHDMFWLNRRLIDKTNSKHSSTDDKRNRKKDIGKSEGSILDKIKIICGAILDISPMSAFSAIFNIGGGGIIISTFCLCVMVSLIVGSFFLYHLYLALTGQTTVEHSEWKSNRPKFKIDGKVMNNLFDQGRLVNLQLIFGKYPWYIGLLPFVYSPDRSIPVELHTYLTGLKLEEPSVDTAGTSLT